MLLLAASATQAQQPRSYSFQGAEDNPSGLRSLQIEDGAVFIDGRQVYPDQLPEGFPPEGTTVEYVFLPGSDEDLRIHVRGGAQYALQGDTLKMIPDIPGFPRNFDPPVLLIPPDSSDAVEALFAQKTEALLKQAKRLMDLQQRLTDGKASELEQMAEEMALHAMEAARTASEFPHIQTRRYLMDIQDTDKALFDRLMRERRMEREASRMARKFAAMEEGEARRDSVGVLQERLDGIFELKQENRRREVEQIEEKLQELRKAIVERERFRSQIVDRRLKELLGDGTLDW